MLCSSDSQSNSLYLTPQQPQTLAQEHSSRVGTRCPVRHAASYYPGPEDSGCVSPLWRVILGGRGLGGLLMCC